MFKKYIFLLSTWLQNALQYFSPTIGAYCDTLASAPRCLWRQPEQLQRSSSTSGAYFGTLALAPLGAPSAN